MCETGHNNLTFTTDEQKTGWERLEAYLRYNDFAENSLKQLKTAYFKHFEDFPAIEILKKTNFALNHCEYM